MEFRDNYKNDILSKSFAKTFSFEDRISELLASVEKEYREKSKIGKTMRKFEETEKSQKTVSSMIMNGLDNSNNSIKFKSKQKAPPKPSVLNEKDLNDSCDNVIDDSKLKKLNQKFNKTMNKVNGQNETPKKTESKKGKVMRKWDTGAIGEEAEALDFSSKSPNENDSINLSQKEIDQLKSFKGSMRGDLCDVEVSDSDDDLDEDPVSNHQNGSKSSFSLVSKYLKNVTGTSGPITKDQLKPCMEQLKERLVGKNVAGEIATKMCESVADRLVGIQLGTFERLNSRVKTAMEESCVRLLTSSRRVDILRDIINCKSQNRPYSVVFCGVNGVGKSTNLAKICFWLNEKNFRVLIAACDTFRSGAVEQLRTHVKKLNFIHPPDSSHGNKPMVELYEKGYGKDASGIASSAINYAKENKFDVVLVDTAGRMQDNEPLMKALSKLINVNNPDLCLFVGEALVGNEAVDQLKKFNQSLADHSHSEKPRGIDGIVLTKFDTIDDKVGAAISMAYISGQPIVFVGTGQTYEDLRHLSVPTIVKALLK